jgi:hypothetical protein
MASSSSERRYKVDPITARLSSGERPLTWGLNVNAHRMQPEPLRAPYEALRASASAALAGTGAYVYPFQHLHITVSSPAPFTHTTIVDEAARAEAERVVLQVLQEECVPGKDGFPDAPFPLIYERPRLDPNAALFQIGDPTSAIPRIRAALARCYARPELAPYVATLVPRTPGIVHSTFVRFAEAPADGVTDDDIAQRFEEAVVKVWQPVTVMADALRLVREVRAYMHLAMGPGEADDGNILAAIAYGDGGSTA